MFSNLPLCQGNQQQPDADPYVDVPGTKADIADDPVEVTGVVTGGNLSDIELAESVRAAMKRHKLLPFAKVRAVVRNGWLILDGEVENPGQKRSVEEAIKGLNGIRGISNNILIESEAIAQRVTRKINEAFIRGARLSAHRISVTARDHKVTLCGSVRSLIEREEAEAAAWAVPGVAEVVNRLRTA